MSTMIFGVVAADAGIVSGSGNFSAQNIDPGVYSLSFNSPFTSIPTIVLSQVGNFTQPDNLDCAAVGNLTASTCIVTTGDAGGNRQNRQFAFIAIGT